VVRRIRTIDCKGLDLLRDPLLNKGAAFSAAERVLFDLDGLLPGRSISIDVQRQRVSENLDHIADPLEKYVALAALHDRNEHLFFNLLINRLEDLLPIVYTPTVGLATQRFSHVFQRGRGIWITPDHRGRIRDILRRARRSREIGLIVATDNESILGIGDQGAGGIAISIGKLALYTAAAGIDPARVLPVSLDVGTDNEALLADPFYLGWSNRRLRGSAYDDLLEEFVGAVAEVLPGALVQWEDFRKDNALRILERYRNRIPSFNDDIQGTGAVALAAILAAQRVTGRRLAEERIVIVGGGAAGLGISRQIRAAMTVDDIAEVEQRRIMATLDSKGLITDGGKTDTYKAELAFPEPLARELGLAAGSCGLAEVVARFRPTVLIGTSGQPGAFTETIVREMNHHVAAPVILPLSNPTANCEAHPADLYAWTGGKALVATGSPFPDVVHGGRRFRIGQGNNAYIFPGVGLAVMTGRCDVVSDEVFLRAARALASLVTEADLADGMLFPAISRLREVSLAVASAVLASGEDAAGKRLIEARLSAAMWEPVYDEYRPG
jgi:malic enzyme